MCIAYLLLFYVNMNFLSDTFLEICYGFFHGYPLDILYFKMSLGFFSQRQCKGKNVYLKSFEMIN